MSIPEELFWFEAGRKLGWLEATIDGEGNVTIKKSSAGRKYPAYSVTMGISNSSLDFIRKAESICAEFGGGKVYSNEPGEGSFRKKTVYYYDLYADTVRKLLPLIELVANREQRILALEALSLIGKSGHRRPKQVSEKLEELYKKMQALHPRRRKRR